MNERDAVVASYEWNEDEYFRAQRAHRKTRMRPAIAWALYVVVGLIIVLTSVVVLVPNSTGAHTSPSLLFVNLLWASVILWYIPPAPLLRWQCKNGWRNTGQRKSHVRYDFAGTQITIHTETGQATANWNALLQVVEASDGFLFYSLKNFFHWAPFSAFANDADIQRARDFIQQSGVPVFHS